MKKNWIWISALGVLIVLMIVGGYLLSFRSVVIELDGEAFVLETNRRQVSAILKQADLKLREEDHIKPAVDARLAKDEIIQIDRAVWVQCWQDGEMVRQILTADRIPAVILQQAGVNFGPQDLLLWNGKPVPLDEALPQAAQYVLQMDSPQSFSYMLAGEVVESQSSAPTLAAALWDEGIHLRSADAVSSDLERSLDESERTVIDWARMVTIETANGSIEVLSSSATVGAALQDAGLALQQMDYAIPAVNQPMPEDGRISLTRVNEAFVLEQIPIPYGRQFEASAELELDQRQLLEFGQYGLEVQRTRFRYESGVEVAQATEAQWVASEPQDELLGYGQKVVVRTVDTEYGPLEYYRAVQMYATSYRPCAFSDGCHYTTAGGYTVEKGVVALAVPWYRMMAGQQVYVPGYGRAVVGDAGGGIPGRYWIDLAYSDDDYVGWHHWVTVYFLTPIPENILWILP